MTEKTPLVLDSWALLAFYRDEPSAGRVETALRSGRPLHLCVVNWGEFAYVLLRERGADAMIRSVQTLDLLGIAVESVDRDVTLEAARIKARGGLSYADAFCAATAVRLGASVLTGDREFRVVEDLVKIEWL